MPAKKPKTEPKPRVAEGADIVLDRFQGLSLYQISKNILELHHMMMDVEGDLTEEADKRAFDIIFSDNETRLEVKLDNIGGLYVQNEGNALFLRQQGQRLVEQAIKLENVNKRLKSNVCDNMMFIGEERVETKHFVFRVQKNGGKTALNCSTAAADLFKTHPELVNIEYSYNDEAIRDILTKLEPYVAEQKEHDRIVAKNVQIQEMRDELTKKLKAGEDITDEDFPELLPVPDLTPIPEELQIPGGIGLGMRGYHVRIE